MPFFPPTSFGMSPMRDGSTATLSIGAAGINSADSAGAASCSDETKNAIEPTKRNGKMAKGNRTDVDYLAVQQGSEKDPKKIDLDLSRSIIVFP
jgi:hypothetical protein